MRFFRLSFVAFVATVAPLAAAYAAPPQARAAHAPYATATTPLSKLLADPAAKAIIDAHIPGMTSQHGLMFVKGKSLKAIQGMSKGGITDEQLAAIDADFAKLR